MKINTVQVNQTLHSKYFRELCEIRFEERFTIGYLCVARRDTKRTRSNVQISFK